MAVSTYPPNQIENGEELKYLLGDFWTSIYDDATFIDAHAKATDLVVAQTNIDLNTLSEAVSRFDVPVYKTTRWEKATFLQSTVAVGTPLTFGSSKVFGAQPTGDLFYFGQPTDQTTTLLLPTGIVDIPMIFNRITDPSRCWIKDIDYIVLASIGKIVFRDNPFNDELVVSQPVVSDTTDTEITLWLYNSTTDDDLIYRRHGYAVNVKLDDSSDQYKQLINAICNGITGCTSKFDVIDCLSAMCDVPIIRNTTETVETISQDANHKLVITDKAVYRLHLASTINVAVGQVLEKGAQLNDALQLYSFETGSVPASITEIVIPPEYVGIAVVGDFTFVNSDQATTVTTVSNFTKITFPITGTVSSVNNFWTEVHTRGIAAGTTLAHLLDTRTNKEGEPGPSNLPSVINPAEFLAENVLRNNLWLAILKPAYFGDNPLDSDIVLAYIRKIVPANKALLTNFVS